MALTRIVGWTLLALVGLDVGVGLTVNYHDTAISKRTRLALYLFEGESLESKFKQIVRFSQGERAAVRSGWVDDVYARAEQIGQHGKGELSVTVYGMSFSNHVGVELPTVDEGLTVRLVAGPSAPLSHSFYTYLNDPKAAEIDVPILGILLDSLPGLHGVIDAGYHFRNPHAFMFPRYTLENGTLAGVEPEFRHYAELVAALEDPPLWSDYRAHVLEHDDYIDRFLFDASFADESFILRLIRRAWARHRSDKILARWKRGEDQETMAVAGQILAEFRKVALARRQRPVVALFNALGYNAAEGVLADRLEREHIAFVKSSSVCPPENPVNFVPGGHFTKSCNYEIARQISRLIRGMGEGTIALGTPDT